MAESENEVKKEIEKKVTEGVTSGVTMFVTAAVTFGLTVVILKFVWVWTIADLFPGAVNRGLINGDLTWFAALKLAVLVSVMGGVYHTLIGAFERK